MSNVCIMDLSKPEPFRKQIAEAQSTLQTLYALRRKVDERVADIRELIRANANFLPDLERTAELMALEIFKVPTTIAEAIKLALFVAFTRNEKLTPVQL